MAENQTADTSDDAGEYAAPTDDEILAEMRTRYKACQTAEGDNRLAAKDDLLFLTGGENQWDPIAVAARKLDGRPIITVNTLPNSLHQVTNDQRLNTPSIKVHPVGSGADVQTAKVRQGVIRHIEYDSNADVAYDTAVNSAAAVGFGYFRLVTDYKSPDSFNQKIMFQRIRNALSVKIDPLNAEPDGSGMMYCFVELKMSKDIFKKEYPDAEACTTTIFNDDSTYVDWLTDTEVLVCDYYCIETEPAIAVLLSNGESGFKDELVELPENVTIVKERKSLRRKTMLYKTTAVDILARTEIKCKWIPVFPVYGDEIDIEGKIVRSGIIRNAKGPAQGYNVMMTNAVEEVSLRAKAPYIMAEGQEQGHEDEWAQANNRAAPYLTYKPITLEGNIAPPPERNPMADIPVGMLSMASHFADNVKKTTGLFDASLGARGNATSGVQEKAQIREGDVANYHYMDGLLRTIRHAGRCLNHMIKNYYDYEDMVEIMQEDGTVTAVPMNTPQRDANGAVLSVLNDMTGGEYTVTISSGQSFTTMREESATFFTQAMASAKDPATLAVVTYLAIKNQDVPGADVATKMMETLLPPSAQQVLAEEKGDDEQEPVVQTPQGPLPVSQVPQVLQNLTGQLEQAGEAVKQAQVDKQQAEVLRQQSEVAKQNAEILKQQNEAAKLSLEEQNLQIERERLEIERVVAEANLEKARADTLRADAEAGNASRQLDIDDRRVSIESTKADSELVNANEAHQAAVNEAAAIIKEMMPPPPQSMKITAPSGQVYDVAIKSGEKAETVQ